MLIMVSVREVGGRFACYLAGRNVHDAPDRDAAVEWASAQLRNERYEMSRHSIVTAADVAAWRALVSQE